VVPVIAAQLWRRALLQRGGPAALAATLRKLQPASLVALLATLVLLFGFQGEQIVRQPLVIALLAVPIVIQVYLNGAVARSMSDAGKLRTRAATIADAAAIAEIYIRASPTALPRWRLSRARLPTLPRGSLRGTQEWPCSRTRMESYLPTTFSSRKTPG
jgi:ACR3 family arsenite efflux pump ArsB